jgi:NitT/TauT family transport system substrate-binding protein
MSRENVMRMLDRHAALLAGGLMLTGLGLWPAMADAQPMRIAFGDIATVESLHFLTAIERAKEAGLEVETTFFKSEDIAAQAVVGGQADVGVGTPYALLQKVNVPIRLFYQMSVLRFYPVVNSADYQSWEDLDGQEIAVHSRGSGTEAIMQLMAQRHGIEYGRISYVPGAEVRTGALLQGNVKASIVDSTGMRILEEKAPGQFTALPVEDVEATDEALYARMDYLEGNPEAVDMLVESLLETWREVLENPSIVAQWREQYGLLPDLPPELEADIEPYFAEAAEVGLLPKNGGSEEAVRADLEFYSIAGQLEGDPDELKVEDFWDFGALDRAVEKLGRL